MIWIGDVLVSRGEGGVYNERMLADARVWDPYRSKLAALYHVGKGVELEPSLKVLYLGAANGTTVSHVADYVEVVYAVEFAPRPMQDLIEVARRRRNVIPIMADATCPETYRPVVEYVDILYQDVAQPDQAAIAVRNSVFLRGGGYLILMLKTRSVDVRKDPTAVFDETLAALENAGFSVLESVWLAPYHQDHAAIVCKKPEIRGE
ncbi:MULTISPECIES: fibrillarin-like rRNA/tRNA 2'-O-methyltransferase [unclassified Methanoregula]|uniref:fibrillarin-like rRNA/tRNA 2'-O-methyltransferase n=1 Tax=unclassified Methanoregula TaxID=2649730 RepID=UPI0009D37279|nr:MULTISPECIES: fibrillarin-like rRNA/tRNA 2'-O-methyltransferase [unclassified Methanoregula]OPX61628.1 MAG: Fibrillarin-like rRNA/tRNA 2'-O-methyltransferase [Methanoregula sp. PtaB.Bin085]OPY34063.1 MAG: Fibrillarin-like rRNA/tRNA 2'-O-methyltransferase [Methanoregula sp. PtaU1.Bin006]